MKHDSADSLIKFTDFLYVEGERSANKGRQIFKYDHLTTKFLNSKILLLLILAQ